MNIRLVAKLTSNPQIETVKKYNSVMTKTQYFSALRKIKKSA